MLTKAFPVLLALAIAVGVLAELAFTRSKAFTIEDALTDAEVSVVTISGTIKRPSGSNDYIITDETGAAELQTCPDWYRHVDLKPGEQVVVTGEILRDAIRSEWVLYSMAVYSIQRENGAEIIIRTKPGKAPWATGEAMKRRLNGGS